MWCLNMKKVLDLFVKKKKVDDEDLMEAGHEYIELDSSSHPTADSTKITVRTFTLDKFADVKDILEILREGYTVCLINIHSLKEHDVIELKRAINKLKKTCEAIDGDVAGFGDDYLVCVPSYIEIYRSKGSHETKEV